MKLTLRVSCCFLLLLLQAVRLAAGDDSCNVTRYAKLDFTFQKMGRPGIRSCLVGVNPIPTVALGLPMPPIILQAENEDEKTLEKKLDWSLDGTTVLASIRIRDGSGGEPLKATGNVVEMSQGEVIFNSLTLLEEPTEGMDYAIRFSMKVAEKEISVWSGTLVYLGNSSVAQMSKMRLANKGFIFRESLPRLIPVGVALPYFAVDALDQFGNFMSTIEYTLQIAISNGTVYPTQHSGKGRIEFNNMLVVTTMSSQITLTFTTTSPDTGALLSLTTAPLSTVLTPVRNKFMIFDAQSSFVAYDNEGNTAVLGLPLPPIIIRLYTSTMQPDTSNTGLVITASSEQAALNGAEALCVRGVAQFSDLTFINFAPRSAVITFTAGSQSSLAVEGQKLFSGAMAVNVAPIKSLHIKFADRSPVKAAPFNVLATATGFIVPLIVVEMRDSAYQLDFMDSETGLFICSEPHGVATTIHPGVTTENGMAAFVNVEFTLQSPLNATPPFTLRIYDEREVRTPAFTGQVFVKPVAAVDFSSCLTLSTNCPFTLEFSSPVSFVQNSEVPLFTTVGGSIPEIRIKIKSPTGYVTTSGPVPVLYAFMGDTLIDNTLINTDGEANIGRWQNSEYVFRCLQVVSEAQSLERIYFQALTSLTTKESYLGIPRARTGFVTVVADSQPLYGLRFAKDASHFVRYLQPSSAVIGVALPTVTVELLDSLLQQDESNNGIEIVASADGLDLQGTRQTVSKGRATFSILRFSHFVDKPSLTFRVATSGYPVSGAEIHSGLITVTELPVPATEIQFLKQLNNDNMVTHDFCPLAFDNLHLSTLLKVVVIVMDSAHIESGPVDYNITVEATSDELLLPDSARIVTIPSGAPLRAKFSIPLTNVAPGFQGSLIYVKFTVQTIVENPQLSGSNLIVGPITFAQLSTVQCTISLSAPIVIAQYKKTVNTFRQEIEVMRTEIANVLAIEPSRVKFGDSRGVTVIDPPTTEKYAGTKVEVQFGDPLRNSTNTKSSAALAAEFVAVQGRTSKLFPSLQSVFFKSSDEGCDFDKFDEALNTTQLCLQMGRTECDCFEAYTFTEWGEVCLIEDELRPKFVDMCSRLAMCPSATIKNICEEILQPSTYIVLLLSTTGGGLLLITFGYMIWLWWRRRGEINLHRRSKR